MENRKLFVFPICGFIAGITASSFQDFNFSFALFLILFGTIFSLFSFLGLFQEKKKFLVIALIFIGFGIGVARYEVKDFRKYGLDGYAGEKISLEGIIDDEIDERENYNRVILKITEISYSEKIKENAKGTKILIYVRQHPLLKYGDKISVKGILQKPKNFINDQDLNSRSFNWPAYLAKDDIFYEMFYPEIIFIEPDKGNFVKSRLFSLKEKFLNNLEAAIPYPESALVGGIVLGAKKSVPESLQNDLVKVGVIHIIVLSGYNITIIGRALLWFFGIFSGPFISTILAAFGILLFAVMTGGSASVARASIMALIALFAQNSGRIYSAIIALVLAGILMLIHNPKILVFDASFQLSFLATLGLIYFTPIFERLFKFLPKKFKVQETVSTTLSAQISVVPFLLYTTGNLSLVALFANFFILLFIPATMMLGFIAGILGFLSRLISLPFAWITYLFLHYEVLVVKIFSSFPFGFVKIEHFPFVAVIFTYGIIIFFARRCLKSRNLKHETCKFMF